eukprot:85531-Alexandrium_andersonii.AAC.1
MLLGLGLGLGLGIGLGLKFGLGCGCVGVGLGTWVGHCPGFVAWPGCLLTLCYALKLALPVHRTHPEHESPRSAYYLKSKCIDSDVSTFRYKQDC